MKNKIIGFALAVLSVATIGLMQLDAGARKPEQVGNAPVCKVTAIGVRGSTSIDLASPAAKKLAFKLNAAGNHATVNFKVTGVKNCKVRITANSFYAPALNGKPWSKQVLYGKPNTKIFTPGKYSMGIQVPTKKNHGMCFYQVDLTYGVRNQLPVLAYGHGKIKGCKKKPIGAAPLPMPSAKCESLKATITKKQNNTVVTLSAKASTKNKAKIKGYTFVIKKDGTQVKKERQNSKTYTYRTNVPGDYTAKVIVHTTVGDQKGPQCEARFTVKPKPTTPEPKNPGIKVTKLVEGENYKRVNVDVEYDYQLAVTNTGDVALKNVVVTDTPQTGVTLVSAEHGTIENNTWTHTIAELGVGETVNFTLKAKVPVHVAGKITNTVCVDAPEIPGEKDDCDTADVDVPEPAKVVVCDPDTGDQITVDEKDEDNYLPVDDPACQPEPKSPVEKTVVKNPKAEAVEAEVLPTTGPAEVFMQLVGAASLAGASAYYLTSRR